MTEPSRYLLDVNVLVALANRTHEHHNAAYEWFTTPGRSWATCAFTEAGFLRYMIRPSTGASSFADAERILTRLSQRSGHRYQPISSDWQTLCKPFATRLFGHQQITDAYLLGLAIEADLVLATFDKAILHLAGESARHVLVLSV